jgi:hypothetical protein
VTRRNTRCDPVVPLTSAVGRIRVKGTYLSDTCETEENHRQTGAMIPLGARGVGERIVTGDPSLEAVSMRPALLSDQVGTRHDRQELTHSVGR